MLQLKDLKQGWAVTPTGRGRTIAQSEDKKVGNNERKERA